MCEPPSAQAGYSEVFISENFLMKTMSRKDALKCALTLNNLQQGGIPFRSTWFSVARFSMYSLTLTTSFYMGVSYLSPTILHSKRMCIRERDATLPAGATSDREGRTAITPSTTTPCIVATK